MSEPLTAAPQLVVRWMRTVRLLLAGLLLCSIQPAPAPVFGQTTPVLPIAQQPDGAWALPCTPTAESVGARMQIRCTRGSWSQALEVRAVCPTNFVLRDSYPRVLVDTDVEFRLLDATWSPSPAGNSSAQVSPANLSSLIDGAGEPLQAGVWRNFVLRVRSQRFTGAPGERWFGVKTSKPNYFFHDDTTLHGTVNHDTYQVGPVAVFRWQAPSANRSQRGRRYDVMNDALTQEHTAPAYPVAVTTSCGHTWSASWEAAEEYREFTGNCQITPDPLPADWTRDGCAGPGDARPFVKKLRWATLSTGANWQGIDMRGVPNAGPRIDTPYAIQWKSTGGGYFKGDPNPVFDDAMIGIWVPVVEVQSVLRGEACMADLARCP
jgi:hypothetical protein